MLPRTNWALKEWTIVLMALGDRRQTILLRKGGIEEHKEGFQVTHPEFFLFPTYVHQRPADLIPAVHAEFAAVQAAQPTDGTLRFEYYATVEDVFMVTDLERLRALEGEHVLSWSAIESRFHYRNRPILHVMTLRAYRLPRPVTLKNTPRYDGCVSWVDLDEELATAGSLPVLDEAAFRERRDRIRALLAGAGAPA